MNQEQIEGGALVAAIAAMVVVSWASTSDVSSVVTLVAGIVLALGLATPTVLRYVGGDEDEEEET